MSHTDTHHCPACNSPNLWADEYNGLTYKHCYECTFSWDSRMDLYPGLLEIEAHEYNTIHLNWEDIDE